MRNFMLICATVGGFILASTVPLLGAIFAFAVCGGVYGFLNATRLPFLLIPALLAASYLPTHLKLGELGGFGGIKEMQEFQTFLMAVTAILLVLFGVLYSVGRSWRTEDEEIKEM